MATGGTTTPGGLPFSGAIDVSRHASYTAAKAAEPVAVPQVVAYLGALRRRYPDGLTDQEAAALLDVKVTTICARRNPCVQEGLVESHGTRDGDSGTRITVWRLTR